MIDDDPASHLYHQIMLEEAGVDADALRVDTSYTVDQALEQLNDHIKAGTYPQLILLDLNMPAKSGWVFLEEFRKLSFPQQPPKIIIVTNSENPAEIRRAKEYPEVIDFRMKFLTADFFKELLA